MQTEITKLVDDFERGRLNRRQLVAYLTALTAAVAGAPVHGQEAGSTFQARGVDHVALRVTDIDRSRRFYEDHLGLKVTDCGSQSCFLSCGDDFRLSGSARGFDNRS